MKKTRRRREGEEGFVPCRALGGFRESSSFSFTRSEQPAKKKQGIRWGGDEEKQKKKKVGKRCIPCPVLHLLLAMAVGWELRP